MSATYMLKTPARALVAQAAVEDHHSFLVGTCSLRHDNEIRVLRYFEEEDDVECTAVYTHPHTITALAPHPRDAACVATVYRRKEGMEAAVWRMPPVSDGPKADDGASSSVALTHVCDAHGEPAPTRSLFVTWFPAGEASTSSNLLAVTDSCIRVMQLQESGIREASCIRDALPPGVFEPVCGVDPHHASSVTVAHTGIHGWDTRSGEATHVIAKAHTGGCVRAVSYNPNKPWHLASAGDDYRVKLWDTRRVASPVKILDGHTHWAVAASFNPFHDQLLLSAGCDARVCLWRVSSVSSVPLLELGDEDVSGADASAPRRDPRQAVDMCLRAEEGHEDSVYAAAWSAHNAWVYASLSYSGKVLFSQVPSTEKYKILL